MRALILGGNAAGMSAASRIRRRDPSWEVVVLEQTQEVSYGACGMPYYVAGLNDDLNLLRIRSVETFRESGIDVRLGWKGLGVDVEGKTVRCLDDQGAEQTLSYDALLVSTGASPIVPRVPGVEKDGVFTLKKLSDAQNLRKALEERPRNVVIVGGGYIGMEIAEACLLQKANSVRIIEAAERILTTFDPEFSRAVQTELESHGAVVCAGEKVIALEGEGAVGCVVTDKGRYDADLVILCVGVRPNTALEGLTVEKLPNGAIVTSPDMRSSAPDIFAAGDCATVWHRLLEKPVYLALGTNANKQGRLAGDAILGKDVSLRRALGTSMLRCMGIELAKTGLTAADCAANGIPCKVSTVTARSHARYYPDAVPLTIRLCYGEKDSVLLGAQIMGAKEAAWRIDPFACAIDQGMTVQELGFLDLGYAPPFASVWDAVQIAANASK